MNVTAIKRHMRKLAMSCVLIGVPALAIARGNESIVAIKSGTSFGRCAGYCSDQMELKASRGRYEQEARRYPNGTKLPARSVDVQITPSQWSQLVGLARQAGFSKKAEVIGCPDCDDGGAEWIEVLMTTGARRRITFAYHEYPARVLELGQKLAAIREDARRTVVPAPAPDKSAKPAAPAQSGQ